MANSMRIFSIVQSVLDHLNPKNITQMAKNITALRALTTYELDVMAYIIHKRALNEPDNTALYVQLCASIVNVTWCNGSVKGSYKLFKSFLLSKCYDILYSHPDAQEHNKTLKTSNDDLPTFYGDLDQSQMENYNLYLANIKFNAELYVQGVLPEKSMWTLITDLLKENGDLQLHCLCLLLKITGSKLSKTYSMAKAVGHLLILERDPFREIIMSTTFRPLIHEITDMYFYKWIHEDPDQSYTKKSCFKYKRDKLIVKFISEFIYRECYSLLNNFEEETDLDEVHNIMQQISPIVLCLLKNDQTCFVVSLTLAALNKNINIRLKAANILIRLFKAKQLSKMLVFLGFDTILHDEEIKSNSLNLEYLINDIKNYFKYHIII